MKEPGVTDGDRDQSVRGGESVWETLVSQMVMEIKA